MQPRQRSSASPAAPTARASSSASLHQHDPPARRVHLLAPQRVGGAGGQAEAAVHAVVDQLGLGRADRRRRRARHQMPPTKMPGLHAPCGSKRSLTPAHQLEPGPSSSGPTDRARRAPPPGASSTTQGDGASSRAQVLDAGRRLGERVSHESPERRAADQRRAEALGRRSIVGARSRLQRRHAHHRRRPPSAGARALRAPRARVVVLDQLGLEPGRRQQRAAPPPPAAAPSPRRSAPAPRPRRPSQRTSRHSLLERRVRQRGGRRAASASGSSRARRRRVAVGAGAGAAAPPPRGSAPSVPNEPVNSLARS